MYCPKCKTDLNDTELQWCPKCNAALSEKSQKEDLEKAGAETSDEFENFLEGISEEVDQFLALDDMEEAPGEAAIQTKEQAAREVTDGPVDRSAMIETEIRRGDKPVEQMPTAEIEVDEPDDFIAGIQDQVNEFLDLLEEEMPDDNVPVEEADEEIIELKDIVVVESQKDDGHVEEIAQEDFESADVVALEIPEEILSVEYLAYDDESTQTIDLDAIEDNALVGDISKENLDSKFVPEKQIEKKAFVRGTPRRARRSSRHGFVLAGVFVLLIAVVFSGWFYFKPKPVPAVLPSKPEPAGIARERAPSEDAAARQDRKIVASPQPPVGQTLQVESKADIQIPETQPPRETVIDQSLQPQSQSVAKPHSDMSEAEAPAAENKANLPEPSAVKTPAEKIVSPGETFEIGRAYFTIQVASFVTKSFAESSLKRLKQKGYPAYLIVKENADGFVLYKLRVGKYKTLNQARTVAESWHDSQIKSYIIVQSRDDISL